MQLGVHISYVCIGNFLQTKISEKLNNIFELFYNWHMFEIQYFINILHLFFIRKVLYPPTLWPKIT